MDFNSINWDTMWREEYGESQWRNKSSSKELWDSRAEKFNKSVSTPPNDAPGDRKDYVDNVLARMEVKPDWTVLDIGCGPGTLAIPLAKKAKSVTGLDVSSEMLKYLKMNAETNGLNNLKYINASWQDAFTSGQVKPHDVVVASRSLMPLNMQDTLASVNAIAGRAAYITYPVVHLSFDWEAYKAIGRNRKKNPPYIYMLNMLYQMGIQANLEILESRITMRYANIDEGMKDVQWRTDPLTADEQIKLRQWLEDKFAGQQDRPLTYNGYSLWALIWWKKETR